MDERKGLYYPGVISMHPTLLKFIAGNLTLLSKIFIPVLIRFRMTNVLTQLPTFPTLVFISPLFIVSISFLAIYIPPQYLYIPAVLDIFVCTVILIRDKKKGERISPYRRFEYVVTCAIVPFAFIFFNYGFQAFKKQFPLIVKSYPLAVLLSYRFCVSYIVLVVEYIYSIGFASMDLWHTYYFRFAEDCIVMQYTFQTADMASLPQFALLNFAGKLFTLRFTSG
ncbi:hypothetical protein BKA69DRAFT_1061989 [Paraphysoderma sedebokerense]|nr:hypothetical protein BKA69DRAFT_1061989 [Paraphysoderma sedebokerense]